MYKYHKGSIPLFILNWEEIIMFIYSAILFGIGIACVKCSHDIAGCILIVSSILVFIFTGLFYNAKEVDE